MGLGGAGLALQQRHTSTLGGDLAEAAEPAEATPAATTSGPLGADACSLGLGLHQLALHSSCSTPARWVATWRRRQLQRRQHTRGRVQAARWGAEAFPVSPATAAAATAAGHRQQSDEAPDQQQADAAPGRQADAAAVQVHAHGFRAGDSSCRGSCWRGSRSGGSSKRGSRRPSRNQLQLLTVEADSRSCGALNVCALNVCASSQTGMWSV